MLLMEIKVGDLLHRDSIESGVMISRPVLVLDVPALSAGLRDRQRAKLVGCTVIDVFAKYQLVNFPHHVNASLCAWAAGRRPLQLVHFIPSVERLLGMQANGVRCVTAFRKPHQLRRVVDHRDCLEFALHDLKHIVAVEREPYPLQQLTSFPGKPAE